MSEMKQNRSGQEQFIKQFLHNYLDNPKDQKTVCHILADVGRYYDADCACIFEWNEAHTKITRTYEWVRKKHLIRSVFPNTSPAENWGASLTLWRKKGKFSSLRRIRQIARLNRSAGSLYPEAPAA